jgi:hypothetical protein
MGRLSQADGLDVSESEDGLVIYNERTDRVHHLNSTAALVFQLCDGSRSAGEIADLLQKAFKLDGAPTVEVETCLRQLVDEQLVS